MSLTRKCSSPLQASLRMMTYNWRFDQWNTLIRCIRDAFPYFVFRFNFLHVCLEFFDLLLAFLHLSFEPLVLKKTKTMINVKQTKRLKWRHVSTHWRKTLPSCQVAVIASFLSTSLSFLLWTVFGTYVFHVLYHTRGNNLPVNWIA